MTTAITRPKTINDTTVEFPVRMIGSSDMRPLRIGLDSYAQAAQAQMTLSEYLTAANPSIDLSHGSPIEQAMRSAGFVLRGKDGGFGSIRMHDMLNLGMNSAFNTITRSDGSDRTAAGRLLIAEILLQVTQETLSSNYADFFAGMERMTATTDNLSGPSAEQPLINTTAPEGSRARRIAQGATPPLVASISLSNKTIRVPTLSVAMEITDDALKATNLDLVSIVMAAQQRGERIANTEMYLSAMISGDADFGETALSGELVTAYDASIVAAGVMTQKAWVKWLHKDFRTLMIDWVMCDLDAALAIQNRTGRPTVTTDNGVSPRIDAKERAFNIDIPDPNLFKLDTALTGANTVLGLDSRFAIRRTRNVSASYTAVEQYVMRRITQMRLDYAESYGKLMAAAWKKLVLATS